MVKINFYTHLQKVIFWIFFGMAYLIGEKSFSQIGLRKSKNADISDIQNKAMRDFSKNLTGKLSARYNTKNFFGIVSTFEPTAIRSRPGLDGWNIKNLSFGDTVFLDLFFVTYNDNVLGELVKIKDHGSDGWVKKANINFNDLAEVLIDQASSTENIFNYNEVERDEYGDLIFNKVSKIIDLKLKNKKSLDSLNFYHEKVSKGLKRSKEIQEFKIKKQISYDRFYDSLNVKENKSLLEIFNEFGEAFDVFAMKVAKRSEEEGKIIAMHYRFMRDSIAKRADSLKVIKLENERKLNQENRIKAEENRRKAEENKRKTYEDRRNSLYRRFGKEYSDIILNGQIRIGMTEQMLIESWGKPERINETITRYGIRKQYVYSSSRYVYVENGEIVTIQTSK